MKILLTGADGFIGHHLRTALQKAGHDIYGYDLNWNQDIRNKYQLELVFENEHFDLVIHLAALAGVRRGERFSDEYLSTNITGTKNIIDACERFGVRRLISFSSSSVYGETPNQGPKPEFWPTNPASVYGMTKLMAEMLVNRSNLVTAIIRPFTVYGPNGRKDQVMMRWIDAVKRNEKIKIYAENKHDAERVVRGYTHVSDLVRGVMTLIDGQPKAHATYNLGGAEAVSLADLIRIFTDVKSGIQWQYVGRQAGDVTSSVADIAHARVDLGWQPKEDFAKSVKEIIKEGLRS